MENWSPDCERALNKQIGLEYEASLQYHFLWSHFDRDHVALPHVANYFLKESEEERDHAHSMMEYQNLRGGTVTLECIGSCTVPTSFVPSSNRRSQDVLDAFNLMLTMEQSVYTALLGLRELAEKENDVHFSDYISKFLDEQLKSQNKIAKYIAQLSRIGDSGTGMLDFDARLK